MLYRDTRTDARTDDPVHDTRPARDRTVERRGWGLGPPGPGMILGLAGSLAILVSLFTAWRDPGAHADAVPLRFLVESGLVVLVSGFVPTGWHSRRTVDRYVDAR